MLTAATTREIHVAVDAVATFLAQLLVYDVDIFLLEQSLRCLRELARRRDHLLAAAHLLVLLNWGGVAKAELLALFGLLHGDCNIQLLLGGLYALGAEVIDRMIVHGWAVESKQIESAGAV